MEGLNVKPANIIIAGGPGSGKTTLLNALFSFIPAKERIIVIEDTLRMRPDRVIVGEVRGKEAQDLMTAMNIGKYCMGTLHASTPRETVIRLESEPMNVPSVLVNLVDVFVVMRRYKIDGEIKRVIGEVAETAFLEGTSDGYAQFGITW
ncbi:MAG: CpaF/VirB11 family protein [Candidatus Omnitrophica bacterium]|nr:CpaF/VirB11 family protein [Candidatus Omnitrophota bacterium]